MHEDLGVFGLQFRLIYMTNGRYKGEIGLVCMQKAANVAEFAFNIYEFVL